MFFSGVNKSVKGWKRKKVFGNKMVGGTFQGANKKVRIRKAG